MIHHARGTFTVQVQPLTHAPAPQLARYSINKMIHGDLEGSTQGEMFSAGDPKKGAAGYVAIELVTGTLGGRQGSFALQHSGIIDEGVAKLSVIVAPGSGTGGFTGMSGSFDIQIAAGRHAYVLTYTLPD